MAAASGSRTTGIAGRTSEFNCHSDAMRSIEPGISRFRVRSCGPSRNDFVSSSSGAAAIDGVGGARDIACLVGGEECDDGGDLGGKAEPARRNPVDHLL